MNIDEFKANLIKFVAEVKLAAANMSNPELDKQLTELANSLDYIFEFVNDNQNVSVLKKYCMNSNEELEERPLKQISRTVWNRLEEIGQMINADGSPVSNSIIENYQVFTNLNRKVSGKALFNLLSAFKVLKHLDGHDKTLIILGPNGSGKTSFAEYLKNQDEHVKVIPASKPIKVVGHVPNLYNSSLDSYNQELYKGGVLNQDLLQKLIIGMCREHDDIARKCMATGIKEKETTYERVGAIFNEFFDVQLDDSSFSDKAIKAKKQNGAAYDFNNMSDGERVAFFYISTVVAAPNQSFIIVDEPENHLNPAIYNKIWDRLIDIRKDCQFIFISHTIEFVSARSNYELVKIKNFVYPDKFEFDFMGDSLEDIQTEFIVEILGSRKPILFCEGSKSDYDYRVYEILFGDKYTIVPAGSCLSVERNVEACNLHAMTYSVQSAIGIVDSDLRSDEEVERLKGKHIITLKCNEIEMLLIDEDIFKEALRRVYKEETLFDEFKQEFFNKLEDRKAYIVKRLVKTQVDEALKNVVIDDKTNKTKEDIKNNYLAIVQKIDIDKLWLDNESKVTSIINNRNYDEALKICCLAHGEVLSGLGNIIIPDYAAIALGVLRNNTQLAMKIRNKHFSEINI